MSFANNPPPAGREVIELSDDDDDDNNVRKVIDLTLDDDDDDLLPPVPSVRNPTTPQQMVSPERKEKGESEPIALGEMRSWPEHLEAMARQRDDDLVSPEKTTSLEGDMTPMRLNDDDVASPGGTLRRERDGTPMLLDDNLADSESMLPHGAPVQLEDDVRSPESTMRGERDGTPMQLYDDVDNVESASSKKRDGTPIQVEDDLASPGNTYAKMNKPSTTSAKTKAFYSSEGRRGVATMTLEDRVMQIKEQIEDDYASDTAYILEQSLSNCLKRPPPSFSPVSFLNPPRSFTTRSQEEENFREVESNFAYMSYDEGGGPPKHSNLTIMAKDISQQEPFKIPEYSRYVSISRSFHVQHPELPPNPRLPCNLENKDDEERFELHLEHRKMREMEKARSLRPYRARIQRAIKHAEAEDPESVPRIRAIFKEVLGLDEDGLRVLLAKEKKDRTEENLKEGVDSTYLTGCLACATYHCSVHGVFESRSSFDRSSDEISSSNRNRGKQPKEQLRGFTRRVELREPREGDYVPMEAEAATEPCGNDCYRENARSSSNKTPETIESIGEAIQLMYDLDVQDPCTISASLGHPCKQVHDYMISIDIGPGLFATAPEVRLSKGKSGDNFSNEHAHDKRTQPTPCYHPGLSCSKAGNKCSCFQQKIYCYKQCGCPLSCSRRYKGCRCTGKNACSRVIVANPDPVVQRCSHREEDSACQGCKLKNLDAHESRCECQQINRECDPDICRCGVAGTLSEKEDARPCHNCDIQQGKMKQMVLGASTEAGYGLFLNEAVKFGDYLGEYVGEIIDTEEYERREAARNEKLDPNYMFKLNAQYDVDSAHFGNVTRFINHSIVRPNCRALVKLVNGEHRIGFWSIRNSRRGTELLFDYGAEFDAFILATAGKEGEVKKGVAHENPKSRANKGREDSADDEDDEDSDSGDMVDMMGDDYEYSEQEV